MRISNWQEAMWAAIEARLTTPFAWGINDCAHFAMFILQAETGIDYRERLRNDGIVWSSAEEALRLVSLNGGFDQLVSHYLGDSIPWAWCGQGDVVLASIDERLSLCIHDGAQLVGPGVYRLVRAPFSSAVLGWRI